MESKESRIPSFGWRVKLDHVFPEKWNQKIIPRINQILPLVPLFIRYILFRIWLFLKRRRVIMDFLEPVVCQQWSGVPFGGIGGGTISRSFRGQFCNYQMTPGIYEYNVVSANQFIVTIQNEKGVTVYQNVLSPESKPTDGSLSSWSWNFPGKDAEYIALYPRAWTVYNIPEQNIKLICRQVSPVFPHNYKDTCLPGGVFVWTVENNSGETKHVSITFTFKNGTGGPDDKNGLSWSELFEKSQEETNAVGVFIHQKISDNTCSYAISANKKNDVNVTRGLEFDPKGDGNTIWADLATKGELGDSKSFKSLPMDPGEELACAVCAKVEVTSGTKKDMEFSLVWDMPVIKFATKNRWFTRYYIKYFNRDGRHLFRSTNAGMTMSAYALANFPEWEKHIYSWQQPILDDMALPEWYKSALFNETYYISDGGSVWLIDDNPGIRLSTDPRMEYGKFAYLEGHEYRMYNSYDVHFYASFALAQLWPKLQACIQYDFRDAILSEDTSKWWYLYDGQIGCRKYLNSIPHDLGDPAEQPFEKVNAYNIHDISEWRDLNLKFVLQTYRDYYFSKDLRFLRDMWLQLRVVIDKALTWDLDGDGMIENSGSPDQTYDCWTMTGTSAYCGSLWLASLCCMKNVAKLLNYTDYEQEYTKLLKRAAEAFHKKLWNGQYYNFDCSSGAHASSIMSDQLCGLWYMRASGLVDEEVFPAANVKSALQTLYDMNVKSFCGGKMGAVNGMMPDTNVDHFAVQSEETWTGVVYGLAALMIHEGKIEEGFHTASGIYETVYNKIGLGFATPEALHAKKTYRSIGYMRPLSIWAMQLAWENRPKNS